MIDLTCQSANLPPLLFTSKCLFTLWFTVAPPGLLVSQQQKMLLCQLYQLHTQVRRVIGNGEHGRTLTRTSNSDHHLDATLFFLSWCSSAGVAGHCTHVQ